MSCESWLLLPLVNVPSYGRPATPATCGCHVSKTSAPVLTVPLWFWVLSSGDSRLMFLPDLLFLWPADANSWVTASLCIPISGGTAGPLPLMVRLCVTWSLGLWGHLWPCLLAHLPTRLSGSQSSVHLTPKRNQVCRSTLAPKVHETALTQSETDLAQAEKETGPAPAVLPFPCQSRADPTSQAGWGN